MNNSVEASDTYLNAIQKILRCMYDRSFSLHFVEIIRQYIVSLKSTIKKIRVFYCNTVYCIPNIYTISLYAMKLCLYKIKLTKKTKGYITIDLHAIIICQRRGNNYSETRFFQ